jgi:hypothetical protein
LGCERDSLQTSVAKRWFCRNILPNNELNKNHVNLTACEKRAILRFVTKRVPLGELSRSPRTNAARQLPANAEGEIARRFCVFRLSRKHFRQSRRWPRALQFDRELSGSEGNLDGPSRTPKSRPKTL